MKISKLQLINQKLVNIEYIVNEKFNFIENKTFSLKIDSKINVQRNDKENMAIVILTIIVFDKIEFDKYPFYITMSNVGHFKWDDDIDKSILDELLKSNGAAILLSYLRPLVTQFTSFSNLPPLILPVIDFSQVK